MSPNLQLLLENRWVLLASLILGALLLGLAVRRVRKIAKSDRPDDTLANLAMLSGFGWSSEAVWILTGPAGANLVTPIRVFLFAIFETILLVFMIRAKRNVKTIGHPGRAGRYAWLVAGGMSLVAVWTAHSPGESLLRLLVPLLLTAMWWNGLVGEAGRPAKDEDGGSLNWTPRRILIRLGAITPGDKDVKTVHREHLTQRMTTLYYDSLYGPERKRAKLRSKLARLTLTADDAMVLEAQRRVRRTGWTASTPLPYDGPDAGVAQADGAADAPVTRDDTPRGARVALPPRRSAKQSAQPATSGDADGADPVTQALQLVLTHGLSPRKAAEQVGGTSASTVARRLKEYGETQPDAAVTHTPINGHPVTAGSAN